MVLQAIEKRRSIRKYSSKDIEDKILSEILTAAQYAPSARNKKQWEFIVVRDKDKLYGISRLKATANFLANANVGIVVLGDTKSSRWVEDCAIAAAHIMIQATELGIGSCWIAVRQSSENPEAETIVKEMLGIPERFGVLCVVSLGYPAEEKPLHSSIDKGKIHIDRF